MAEKKLNDLVKDRNPTLLPLSGGCLCGSIRYRATAWPFAAENCHCSMCRRGVGAPFVSWMDFKVDQVVWTTGERAEYHSSGTGRRG